MASFWAVARASAAGTFTSGSTPVPSQLVLEMGKVLTAVDGGVTDVLARPACARDVAERVKRTSLFVNGQTSRTFGNVIEGSEDRLILPSDLCRPV